MRKYIFSFFLCLALVPISLSAQETILNNYDWEEKPVLHELSDEEKAESEIVLLDKRSIEFFYDGDSKLREYNLKHKIVRVNSDKAIKFNNRIYIPFNDGVTILKEKARVINSEGKTRELKEDDIKVAKDEETNQTFRYFAVEGVDLGSEIEYFYVVDKYPSYTGSIITLQSEDPVKRASVEIFSPKNLVFKTKSYNGLPEMSQDTSYEKLNCLRVEAENIPKLKSEESATYTPHLKQLIYKLDKDYFTGRKEVISYDEAAKILYKDLYGIESKKTVKNLEKLIKSKHLGSGSDLEERVRNIENFVKTEFTLVDYSAPNLGDLDEVLENKVSNEVGMTKLIASILKLQGIEHRIVLTTDRNLLRFDPEFEAYNFLQHYIIYINELDLYLAPSRIFLRLGFIPPEWTHNYGLFLEPFTMGDYVTALPKIKFIKAPAYDQSTDNLNIQVNFDGDFSQLNIHLKRESAGYYAQNTQPYYDYLNDEQKGDISEALVKNITPDAEIKSVNVENEGGKFFGKKPFVINAEFTSRSFIEKAGQKYLFKVGELIGPQIEMYQDEERTLEIENDFTRKYHRIIVFNIPDGYEAKNLENLNMNVSYSTEEGDTIMAFISKYNLEENAVTVDITEYYKRIVYPLELYEEYRKVINAAADFNKIGLILEKKTSN